MSFFVYVLLHPLTKEVRYVGKTVDLHIRYRSHIQDRANTHKGRWIRTLREDGLLPEMVPIGEYFSEVESFSKEISWIKTFRYAGCRLTNSTLGGEGLLGLSRSEETRRKISASKKGVAVPMERRIRISNTLKGNVISAVTRAKRSIAMTGRKQSPEHVSKRFQNVVVGVPTCHPEAEYYANGLCARCYDRARVRKSNRKSA